MIAAMLVLSPLVPVSLNSRRWHGAQTLLVEAGAVLLLMALLCAPWSLTTFQSFALRLRQFPFFCLHLLLLWTLISCLRSPNSFAIQGLLTIAFGVLVTDIAAIQITEKRQVIFLVNAVLLAAALVSFSGLIQLGNGNLQLAVGCLHDHQLFGAFMMLPIPLCLALSAAPTNLTQRLFSQAALLICIAGLLESQHRSAWIGAFVSVLVFAGLFLFRTAAFPGRKTGARDQKKQWTSAVVPAAIVVIALFGVVWSSPDRDRLLVRLFSVQGAAESRDSSMQWRQAVWRGTRGMIAEKPFLGWGIGSFALRHEPFTHTGHSIAVVQKQGPSIEDEAHNSYLQTWVELGLVGLLLWLAVLVSFLVIGIRFLKRLPRGSLEQWLLIGCLSAIIGQMVDALANPAWQFGMVILPLWVIFGVTAALVRPSTVIETNQHSLSAPLFVRIIQIGIAAGVGFGLLQLILKTAFALPAPHL